jgi:hypothetical protein
MADSNRARTRAIRARMAETGEPYTLAARNHDLERETSQQADTSDARGRQNERMIRP